MTEEVKQALFQNGVVAIIGPESLVAFRREPTKRAKEKLSKRFGIDFSKEAQIICGMKYYHIKDTNR